MSDHEVHQHERSPLLSRASSTISSTRFSRTRKRVILVVVSLAGLVNLFVPGSFIPSIPQVVDDLHSTPSVISLAVGIFIVTAALGNLFWASYSSYYGRRPIIIAAFFALCIGSITATLAPSAPVLLFARGVQAIGAASEIVGPAIVGDVFSRSERGVALGFFFSACQLGPAVAPVVGGALAHWHSWRTTQAVIATAAGVMLVLVWIVLPETMREGTRGVESREKKVTALNPLRCFTVLKSPNLLAVGLASALILFTDYVLCVPLAYTVGAAYGITNPAKLGAFFIPVGVGNLLGAPLAGRLSDLALKREQSQYDSGESKYAPEVRLAPAMFAAAVLVPGSAVAMGVVVELVKGRVGIALCCGLLFLHGISLNMVLSAVGAYGVDSVRKRSAEVMAANAGLRAATTAALSPAVVPLLESIGVFWTFTIAAIGAWIGFGLLIMVTRYGEKLRAWVDIGWDHDEDE